MKSTVRKVMVLGVDSPIAPRLYTWAKAGKLPTFRKLIEEGVWAENCLAPLPTITPPNWTTIATGAWCGTHGITDFHIHIPGDPLSQVHKAFLVDEGKAEFLWNAVARAGKSAVVVNWPSTWPPRVKNGYQIAGYGLAPTDWQIGGPKGRSFGVLAVDALLSTDDYLYSSKTEFVKASGWSGVEHSPKALDTTVEVEWRRPRDPVDSVTWHVLIDASDGVTYDTCVLAKSKSKVGVYARLKVGEWSDNIIEDFGTTKGPQQAVFRVKLIELTPDARRFRLYVLGPCALQGWGHPAEIEGEINALQSRGVPIGKAAWEGMAIGWVDEKTVVEVYEFENQWLTDATLYLLENKPWDVFFTHLHTVDWLYHYLTLKVDPATAENPDEVAYWQGIELRLYECVDRALSRLLLVADDQTLVVVVSDHGAKVETAWFNINDILEGAGLLTYLPGEEKDDGQADKTVGAMPPGFKKTVKAYEGLHRIDWSKTKAVGQRFVHVYVNLKGRDPQGIVEPGEEYEKVVQQIIDALYSYVEPETGKRPIALALGPEDRRILGHYGDRSGDVVYAVSPEFGVEHGPHLSTARKGIGDLRATLILKGPGVKKGVEIDRTVWLTDIVPTICHIADLPVPEQCEGAVIYQALEDPDAGWKELESLRRNVDRLKRMVERPPMC